MPAIMTLQGPNLSGLGALVARPIVLPLAGPVDTMRSHPWATILGLALGGYAAYRGWKPSDALAIWGEHRLSHARNRSLHGARRRRRK